MLFINKEQKTVEEVAKMFNINLDKIEKGPEFELNPAKKGVTKPGQSKELGIPAGTRFPATFTGMWNGKGVEIRYAETTNDEQVGDKMVTKYYPPKVMFVGESHLVDGADRALALYFYLFPLNETSPFRKQLKGPHSWSFKDLTAKGEARMGKFSELTSALNFIGSLSGDKLRVYAKGMGLSGVERLEDKTIQADLADMASLDPAGFNSRIDTNQTLFKGSILNGIDSGMFKLDESQGKKTWRWGTGVHNQEEILTLTSNAQVPAQALLEHVMGNVNIFFDKMLSAQKIMQSRQVADDFFSKEDFNFDEFFEGGDLRKETDPVDPNKLVGGGSNETSEEDIEGQGSVVTTISGDKDPDEEMTELAERHRELFGRPKPPSIGLPTLRAKILAEEQRLANNPNPDPTQNQV